MGTFADSEDPDESCILWHFIRANKALFVKVTTHLRDRNKS